MSIQSNAMCQKIGCGSFFTQEINKSKWDEEKGKHIKVRMSVCEKHYDELISDLKKQGF